MQIYYRKSNPFNTGFIGNIHRSTNQEAPSESRPLHFKVQIPFDMGWRKVLSSVSERCQASRASLAGLFPIGFHQSDSHSY
ncbi:hypothetical protein TNCV_2825331 [Trichonephila clavipes]|nr:hypothetical protein TNCV_2825331 [Trichonephila clavipes]